MLKEFEIINTYFKKLSHNPASLGLLDDCAIFQETLPLVLNTDTLIENGHFFSADEPESVACKMLAVNLSDLAAMGATPKYWLFNLAINKNFANHAWLQPFSAKLLEMQKTYNISLIGGDTTFTKGAMVISVTLIGTVLTQELALQKTTAQIGDSIYVSNNIGDALFGYKILKSNYQRNINLYTNLPSAYLKYLVSKYKYPTPQIALGQSLGKYASSCTDISDGLIADLEKLCILSKVSGTIDLQNLYDNIFSPPVQQIINSSANKQESIIQALSGGDDYELIFTVCPSKINKLEAEIATTNIKIHKIGEITKGKEPLIITDLQGKVLPMNFTKGFEHSF